MSPTQRTEQSDPEDSGRSLAKKIEWLIQHRWPADAHPPTTNRDVATAITAATGGALSDTAIWKLRTGRGANPRLSTLSSLARFFHVPVGFFADDEDAERLGAEAALATLLRDKGIKQASLLALTDLSAPGLQMVEDMIQSVARMERERENGDVHP